MNKNFKHNPVLLHEVLANLAIKKDGIYIDATFGRGGHTKAILQNLSAKGLLLALDKDPEAVQWAKQELGDESNLIIIQGSFGAIRNYASQYNLVGKVNGILLDLGVSSPQLDNAERGFSFLQDGPLDMRFDPKKGVSAATWLSLVKEETLAEIFREYGEERYAKRIAHAIVVEREQEAILTTARLAAVIAAAHPAWEQHRHPATRCFQAIRIFINNELQELQLGLAQSLEVLTGGGRLLVISFHSLEDRIVKRFIHHCERGAQLPLELPIKDTHQASMRRIGKAIKPSLQEITANPRARSAILRVAEKIPGEQK